MCEEICIFYIYALQNITSKVYSEYVVQVQVEVFCFNFPGDKSKMMSLWK